MPSFKPKTDKKIIVSEKSTITLDGKHSEKISDFSKDESRIQELSLELRVLKEKHSRSTGSALSGQRLDHQLERVDRMNAIKSEIRCLKQSKSDYFLDNSKYVFGYFENKKQISDGSNQMVPNTRLDSFFKVNTDAERTIRNMESSNHNIIQRYLSNIDTAFLDVDKYVYASDVCKSCYKGELSPIEDEGVMICNLCGNSIKYLVENDKPSYKEPPKEVCFYAYKKINHFKEILSQFQGKETTQIPAEEIENLKSQITKERIDLSDLTYYKCKDLLKKLGYNKYYEHINFIKNKLGIQPVLISQELEKTLCNFFMEIQYPYAKHCPDYRVNFLHYYYVVYKLFELLDQTAYLEHIPMLKNRILFGKKSVTNWIGSLLPPFR